MNLVSQVIIKDLFRKYGIKPFKGFGQNFLINEKILNKIIESSHLKSEDTVLEIGPGIGTLTQELAKKAKKVIAVEKDKKMIEILKETLVDFKNIELISADILKTGLANYNLKTKNYKLISNLPYNIASAVIRKFLESENPPKEMVLTVQKEVAQRICARPPDMNLLAVSVQFYSDPKIIFYVPKSAFWPNPKVNGAVIRIETEGGKREVDKNLFFKIVKAGFSQPRKQILNNLTKMLKSDKEKVKSWLKECKIDCNQRAETLSIKDWLKLSKIINYRIK